MIWAIVAVLAIIALFCLLAYREGKKDAILKQAEENARGREYVQKIIDSNASINDSELDEWLRKHQNPKG